MKAFFFLVVSLLTFLSQAPGVGAAAEAAAKVQTFVNRGAAAAGNFKFEGGPSPSKTDAANQATISILAGRRDGNGAEVRSLNDGQLPAREDDPSANFFFTAGTDGGRLLIDLGGSIPIQQINAYSWHPAARGPQVFKAYVADVSDEAAAKFDPKAARRGDPAAAGWKLLGEIDTRAADKQAGGQFATSIAGENGAVVANTRYVLLVISRTENDDPFGNTFFSEIDILDGKEHPPAAAPAPVMPDVLAVGDKYEIEFDASDVPEIKPWVDATLKPVCAEWYPKIVELLPSEGYEAPRRFRITFHADMEGVAHCAGTEIHCAAPWFLANLDGEAAGAVVHEMVHVVQQYGRRREGGERNPGWMVEGLADYIRWFLYEPERLRPTVNPERAKYTDSYRTTAAFLDYVARVYDAEAVRKFNAAMRGGEYREAMWQELTGKSVDDLWAEYVGTLKK